jgi:hypothetical protein
MNDDGQFTLRSPDGEIIARGPMWCLLERLPQSVPRMNAEQAIAAAARAIQRERDDAARADALDQREAEIKAREDAARANDIRRFVDEVHALTARMDALEAELNQRALDALPDPDSCATDYLAPAMLEAPAEEDRKQERELMEAEEAVGDELQLHHAEPDQDPGAIPAVPSTLSAIMGEPFEGNELPENTVFPVKSDGFICRRDRKAYRKRMRT